MASYKDQVKGLTVDWVAQQMGAMIDEVDAKVTQLSARLDDCCGGEKRKAETELRGTVDALRGEVASLKARLSAAPAKEG